MIYELWTMNIYKYSSLVWRILISWFIINDKTVLITKWNTITISLLQNLIALITDSKLAKNFGIQSNRIH